MSRLISTALAVLAIVTPLAAFADEREAWAALAGGGHVALIRHGNAPPGHGDPPGYKIDDCTTQRNLDERGREQARAIGEAFRAHGIAVSRILSSPFCRCLETGRLLNLGPVESDRAIASSDRSPERLGELRQLVAAWRGPGALVLVTHAFSVQTLVGFLPEQAETVVVRPKPGDRAAMSLAGRIAKPK